MKKMGSHNWFQLLVGLISISTALFPTRLNFVWALILFVGAAHWLVWAAPWSWLDWFAQIVQSGGFVTRLGHAMSDRFTIIVHFVFTLLWWVMSVPTESVVWMGVYAVALLLGRVILWREVERNFN